MDVLGRITGAGVEEDIDMAAVAAVVAAEAEAVEAKVDLYLTVHDVAGRGVVNPVLGGGVSQVSRFTPLPLNKYKSPLLSFLFPQRFSCYIEVFDGN